MTHRERVLTALSHKEPDMVPIDLGATRNSSIVVGGYEKLKAYMGVKDKNRITNRMMQTVDVSEEILQLLDIDFRSLYPGTPDKGATVELAADRYIDEWGIERFKPEGSYYYDIVKMPLSGQITTTDINKYSWPDPTDPGRWRGLKQKAAEIRMNTDCAIALNLPSAFIHTSQYLRGFEDWYIDLAADHEIAGFLFDTILEIILEICKHILEEVGDSIDVIIAADDLGLQDNLMMPVETYRKLVKPRHEKYFRLMHEKSKAKVHYHTCGTVVSIIDDLIEIGVDILNPVQVAAKGMDPAYLKKTYGGRLSFWGGIDTQKILPYGNVKDVEAEVERMIEIMGKDGGYILGAVHNIQPDVPVENVLALFRHAREYYLCNPSRGIVPSL